MSSSEPEYENNEGSECVEKGAKKRRIQSEYPVDPASALRNRKACDTCKRKKSRFDLHIPERLTLTQISTMYLIFDPLRTAAEL